MAVVCRRLGAARICRISSLTRSRSDFAAAPARADRLHNPIGRGDADVRGDERLFERLDRREVDRLTATRRFVRPLDYFIEPLDELLLRAGQRLFDSVKKAHKGDSVPFSSIDFRPLPPAHQRLDGIHRRRPTFQHFRHLSGDRQLDAVACTESQCRAGRPHALGDHVHAAEDVAQVPAAPELDADVAVAAQVARAGDDEIAEPAETCQRIAPAPLGAAPGVRSPRARA